MLVSADVIFNERFVRDELGLVNYRFIEYRWHIMNSFLAEYFGKEQFNMTNNDDGKMILESTEVDFKWLIINDHKNVFNNSGLTTKFGKMSKGRDFTPII